tara:strand:+ start:518 stop:1030 length:513 start_codon:yes stop_codon:yes gene_type:complete
MATSTYTLIDSTTLGSSAASVTFSGISATGKGDLVLAWEGLLAGGTNQINTLLSFNGDSSNYSTVYMYGNGSSAASASSTAQQRLAWGSIYTSASTDSAQGTAQIMDYSATDKHKTTLMRANVIGTNGIGALASASRWASTAAITSITVSSTVDAFAAGATLFLYQLVSE